MESLHLRPMTSAEYGTFRSGLIKEYAADKVGAGEWAASEAEDLAAKQTDELLPEGAGTPGMLVLSAETASGDLVGHVWVALRVVAEWGGGAWIYAIEVDAEHRGKGYGRALLAAAERETARHGATAIGLNVFGGNRVARSLYESAGYETTTLQMRKALSPPAPTAQASQSPADPAAPGGRD